MIHAKKHYFSVRLGCGIYITSWHKAGRKNILFFLNSKKIFQDKKDRSIKGMAFYLKTGVEIIMARIVRTDN